MAEHCAVLGIDELFTKLVLYVDSVNIVVDIFNRAETLNQVACGFRAYSRNSGDIIGAVALESLYFNHLPRLNAVILFDFCLVIGNSLCSAHLG